MPNTCLPTLPFVHLNLRFNPFGEIDLSDRASVAVVEIDDFLSEMENDPHVAIQFMGDKGRGKTTHLLALNECFPGAVYVHIPEEGSSKRIPHGDPLFVDETQRLPQWRRRMLFRRNVRLVIGTHLNHDAELRRAGRSVRTVYPGANLDAHRLHAIVAERIEWARRSDGPVPGVTTRKIHSLLKQFGDNIRAIEHDLYETFQRLTEITDV